MATTIVQPVQGPQIIAAQPQPQPPENLKTVKGLAMTQFIIGILSLIFGIAAAASLAEFKGAIRTGAGIWAGCWIGFAGLMGICSTRNRNMNGVYMAFSIISTCVSGLAGIFCIVAVVYYSVARCFFERASRNIWDDGEVNCSYWKVGLGLYCVLLILMTVEFFVSIIAAVYCCQNGCGQRTQGVVIHQQPYIATTGGPMVVSGGYATTVQYGGQMAPQYVGQMAPQYGVQMQPQYVGQMPPQYNSQAPPSYSAQGGAQPLTTVSTDQQTNAAYSQKPPGV